MDDEDDGNDLFGAPKKPAAAAAASKSKRAPNLARLTLGNSYHGSSSKEARLQLFG